MPRQVAPPPSGEFNIRLSQPFSGQATHVVEVIGEPNRPAVVRLTNSNADNSTSTKAGDVPADDVNELMSLVSSLRSFPSHSSTDLYGNNTKIELSTFDVQWSNADEGSGEENVELAAEQKDEFNRIAQSIDALARAFAKRDEAV